MKKNFTRAPAVWKARRPVIAAAVLLAGLVCLPYVNTFQVPFLFDDVGSISGNAALENPGKGDWIWKTPDHTTLSGRPVVQWTFALNQILGAGGLPGLHAVNLLVHVLATVVLFDLLRRTAFVEIPATWSTRLAGVSALLWAVHPLNTQAVTYLVQRSESLMALFYLLTLWAAWCGWHSPRMRGVAVAACALGMGTKEVMVSAPLAVVLMDWCLTRNSWDELWRQRRNFYLALAATWLVLACSLFTSSVAGLHAQSPISSWTYLLIQAEVIPHYLRLVLWPDVLVFDYYDWPVPRWGLVLGLKLALLILVFYGAVWGVFRRRRWAVPLMLFYAVLAPTSSLLPLWDPAVEYRMYLPLAFLMPLTVTLVCRLARIPSATMPWMTRFVGGVCILTLTALLWRTFERNHDYRSAESIWADTVEKRPMNPRARQNLGQALVDQGRVGEGLRHMEQALELPYRPGLLRAAHYNLANIHLDRKAYAEALVHYNRAVEIQPGYARARANRALVFMHLRDFASAARDQREALSILRDDPVLHVQHAIVLEKLGDIDGAWSHLQQAERLGHRPPPPMMTRIRSRMGNAVVNP